MREVADRLGVSVEWRNMKAGDLLAALGHGEVQAVIAALPANPGNQDLALFTDPYLLSPEAVVAAKGSALTLAALTDLAGHRVGVVARSPEELWCRENLVAPGLMPETSLGAYPTAAAVLGELAAGRLDCAFVDVAAVSDLLASGDIVKVLDSRLEHEPVIAVGRGQADLLAEMNRVIAALHQEGFIRQLANEYAVSGE